MTTQAALRRMILKSRNIGVLERGTRNPLPYSDAPSKFNKTYAMKLLELRYGTPVEELIMEGNIYELEKRLGVDATTISRWRKKIRRSNVD